MLAIIIIHSISDDTLIDAVSSDELLYKERNIAPQKKYITSSYELISFSCFLDRFGFVSLKQKNGLKQIYIFLYKAYQFIIIHSYHLLLRLIYLI